MSCIEDLFLKMEEHEKYFSAVLHLVFPLQELEIVIGDEHISFTTSKIGSLVMMKSCLGNLWAGKRNHLFCLLF